MSEVKNTGLPASPRELQLVIHAEREHEAFVVYRRPNEGLIVCPLEVSNGNLVIGRRSTSGLPLAWDPSVSRLHAEIVPISGQWVVEDHGTARNGTYLNGERVVGRKPLVDGDTIVVGSVDIHFRSRATATEASGAVTVGVTGGPPQAPLTEAQQRVLIALCRPMLEEGDSVAPTNAQIAAELFLGLDTVKGHMRSLFTKFGLGALPQNEKRARLVMAAIASGLVTSRDVRRLPER